MSTSHENTVVTATTTENTPPPVPPPTLVHTITITQPIRGSYANDIGACLREIGRHNMGDNIKLGSCCLTAAKLVGEALLNSKKI